MVDTTKLTSVARDVLFAPIYLYQGRKIKRDTVRLPEPVGERFGQVDLIPKADINTSQRQQTLTLMVVGDSAAAGVGSDTQQAALTGQLIPALQQQPTIGARFATLSWSLQATTGHTSFDILRRLYVLPVPPQPVDVMVVSVGVNDTTKNVARVRWQQQLEQIIAIAQRKFGVQVLIFPSLPPMAKMPAIPAPLNGFIGAKAQRMDQDLQAICAQHNGVYHIPVDFLELAATHSSNPALIFASDGFHPSSLTYQQWCYKQALAPKTSPLAWAVVSCSKLTATP